MAISRRQLPRMIPWVGGPKGGDAWGCPRWLCRSITWGSFLAYQRVICVQMNTGVSFSEFFFCSSEGIV